MGRFLGISRETDPSATGMSNVKCDMSHFSPRLQVHVALEAFGSHWYRKERVKRVYKAYEKKIGIAAVVSKLTTRPVDPARPPLHSITRTCSTVQVSSSVSEYDKTLHSAVENTKDPEGAPLRSMYIDDQAEEDTDAEMEDSEADYDDEDSMEARVRRDEESTFVRANLAQAQEQWLKGGPRPRVPTPPPFRWLEDRASPTPPGQDMEVEQEGETLAGSPNSMDEESGSETETEEYLPPPSSKTTVAYVISARIRRYFDEQAEDSDEDAGEEREEEEQEMEEDREFVDDTAVDEDFVHRLPSNKDDAREVEKWVAHFQNEDKIAHYKRDVAREAAGEADRRIRTRATLGNARRCDVEPHTWVRAPDQFDLPRRVRFDGDGFSRYPAREGFGAHANAQYVAEMVSQSGAFLRGNRAVRGNHAECIIASRARKPSPALDAGDRVVVTTGDRKDSTGRITGEAGRHGTGAPIPIPRPYPKGKGPIAPVKPPKPFEVGLAQLKRHALDLYYHFRIHDRVRVVSGAFIVHVTRQWAIGDSVRVTRGQYEGQTGVILGSTVQVTWSYSSSLLGTWTSSTNFGLPRQQIVCPLPVGAKPTPINDLTVSSTQPLSQPRTSQRGFEGIEVIVAKSNDFIALSKEAKKRKRGEGHIHIPHKGFIGMIIGDFDSRERSDRLKNGVEPPPERHTGKLLEPVDSTRLRNPDVAGIMVTIRGDHSLETVQVPIENVRHLVQYDGVLGQGSLFFRPPFCSGGNRLNHPRIHALSPIEAPSAATTETAPPPPRSTTPIAANAAVWGSHPPVEGENNGRWLCQPELVGRRLDHDFEVQRTLEGSCGWVLLSEPVTTKTRKVDVCSVGKNQNMYSIDKRCIKPRRDIDSGKWLVEITERVVVIGPDSESDRARTGQYALTEPSYLHAYGNHVVAVKFVDGAHGFLPHEQSMSLGKCRSGTR
ncbi:hypothetical protein B0H14DRAFT_2570856 [Mycena olivaceomarginata]|nr:hypothetical protein B0H14DRAFT_2570856 [Mycena olivaceomarginata]